LKALVAGIEDLSGYFIGHTNLTEICTT